MVGNMRGASAMSIEAQEHGGNGALARLLNSLIDGRDEPRDDVIERMASAAQITSSTVNQILRGEIECPPVDRLSGFARVLDVSTQRLRSAAERDGCNYEPPSTSMVASPFAELEIERARVAVV